MSTFAQRVRASRKDLELNQQELAARAGIRQSAVSDIETGKTLDPEASTLLALARVLEVSPQWLLEGKGVKTMLLREEEQQLIHIYRSLPTEQKTILLGVAKSMSPQLPQQDSGATDTTRPLNS